MRKQHARQPKWIAICGLFLYFFGPELAAARSTGIDTGNMPDGPVTCSSIICHGPLTETVSVTISGPEALVVDETASYTIAITGAPGTQIGAGVTVAAFLDDILTGIEDGILDVAGDEDLQITAMGAFPPFFAFGQLTHVSSVTSTGVFSYDFSVTAPSTPGVLELQGAMNAFDGSLTVINDLWNHTSHFVTVPEPSGGVLAVTALLSLAALRKRRNC